MPKGKRVNVAEGPKVTSSQQKQKRPEESASASFSRMGKKSSRRAVSAATSHQRSRPKMGQHFLVDVGAAEKIVAALGETSEKTVVEIGPGTGALTSRIARRSRRVIAIELDRVLAAQLRMKFALLPNVEVIEGDVLAIDIATLLGPKPGSSRPGLQQVPEKVHVVGNLPYYITSPILLRLFEYHQFFDCMVLMVQREVADRIAAKPGVRDYGLLSATTQLYCRVEKLFDLPPGAFGPPPKVHSSVLRLTVDPRFAQLGVAEDGFIEFLKLLFGQKRKTLANNLKGKFDRKQIGSAFRRVGLQLAVRAEALSLEKMASLFRALGSGTAD
jgi:16S rRNA (adenine1518-N6/adenine1519-N6)-dimethyltransferase